jgi:thiol-disulfide isomerase/thioredoxin
MRWLSVVVVACSWIFAAPASAQNRAWIGITLDPEGCRVREVMSGAPAERAGLHAGDEILSIDGVRVSTAAELIDRVGEKGIGETVKLALRRGGKETSAVLKLEARPEELEIIRTNLVGKPLPELPAGRTDLGGKVVVVEFWATWCSACRSAFPRLAEWHKKFAGRGLRIVSISDEPAETVQKHFGGKPPPWALLQDQEQKAYGRFRVPAIPTFVVVGRDGKVRYVEVGAGDRLDAIEAAFTGLL